MKSDLTTNVRDTLLDLYHATEGKVGVYLEASVKHQTLTALSRRKLVKVRVEPAGNGKTRHAALTRNGAKLAKELIPNIAVGTNSNTVTQRFKPMDTRKRQPITVHFDTANSDHVEALERIGQLKKARSFTGDLIDFLTLDSELKSGETFMLAVRYPAIVEQIRHEAVTDMVADCTALQAQNKALIQMIGTLENQVDMLAKELDKRQPSASVDFAHMMERIAALDGKLDNLQSTQNTVDSGTPQAVGLKALQPVNGGLKPIMSAKPIAAPDFSDIEDDENLLEVKKDEGAGLRVAMNFIKSMQSLSEAPPQTNSSALSARQRAMLEGDNQ